MTTLPPSTGTGATGTVAAVVLAAGAGSRFGAEPKLAADLDGVPLLGHALAGPLTLLADTTVAEVVVVLGAHAARLGPLVPAAATTLVNPDWREGIASSLATAIDHARHVGHEAVVVGLGDQPRIPLLAWQALTAVDAELAVAAYPTDDVDLGRSDDGERTGPVRVRGHPVRLGRAVWDLLPRSGDVGARVVMAAHPELVTDLAIDTGGRYLADVDTAGDLGALRYGARSPWAAPGEPGAGHESGDDRRPDPGPDHDGAPEEDGAWS